MARDDLDPARGMVRWTFAGVLLWLAVGFAFLRAATLADFANVVGGVVGRDPVYAPPTAVVAASRVRIPEAFSRYRRAIETETVRIMGPTIARPAFIAAQLHQESGYNPAARSYVGATGLGQFMPGTAADMAARYPECRPADPLSATWAIRCAILYDLELYRSPLPRAGDELTACTRWAFALSSYNGGAGWLSRDRTLAAKAGRNPDRWQGNVDGYSARSAAAKRENRGYIDRIMVQIAPSYAAAGLLGPLCEEPF